MARHNITDDEMVKSKKMLPKRKSGYGNSPRMAWLVDFKKL